VNIKQFSKGLVNGMHLIPVCCVCGKIRDINNQWHVASIPSTCEPSHTYCPECFRATYPELVAEAEANGLL